jgi:hypothetical protein
MTPQSVESRVESLETRVTNLEENIGPTDAVTPQVLPLRTEMRDGFSALRGEMKALDDKITAVDDKVTDISTLMRVLHEDVIGRIALLHEGLPKPPARKRR